MGDDDDLNGDGEPLTRADFARLEQRLSELADAQEELREARGTGTRQEAREDAADAEDAFEKAAKAAGMSRADIVKAVSAAKSEAGYDQFKKFMDRWVGEQVDDEEEKPKPRKRAQSKKPTSQADQSDQQPEPDSGPVKPHWSERNLSDLLR